jgi:hypothetical protein
MGHGKRLRARSLGGRTVLRLQMFETYGCQERGGEDCRYEAPHVAEAQLHALLCTTVISGTSKSAHVRWPSCAMSV